jgi:hypothetical protein
MEMSQTQDDDVPPKFAKRWSWFRHVVEPVCQFAVEGLFGDVASGIERVQRIGDRS